MGSTNFFSKSKPNGLKSRSGSIGSDKDLAGKLRRTKIRRSAKMPEYGGKRIPDYTELAYKEAVAKLRYFLAGNYSPSVRSYGGGSVSIKNLDESDGDIDKKYSTYTGALAEFKPRTRLSAKYATLYADSLKNYSPPTFNHASSSYQIPPPPGDLAAGTNPDVINFIQKQEEYIEQLERESQYCREELNTLLGKVKEVITENEHLHELQKSQLISKMFTCNPDSESDDGDEHNDSAARDSDAKISRSVRKARRPSKLEGPNIVFESRISELEAQLMQAEIALKKVQEENNENKRKIASGNVDSTCLDGFKRQIEYLQRDKSALEAQLAKLKLSLEQKDSESDTRYKRGSDSVETKLRDEKSNLEAELRRLKDELSTERGKIRELAGEGARRVIQERSAAEQRYNAHFDQLSHDLTAQYDNVAKLQLELERQRREENDLKRELSMKNAAIDELKMELKNKSSTLQADLAHAHAEKASLEEELASARLAMERQQRQAKHETNRLNSEIQSLRQRLDRADADVIHSRRENLRLSDHIASLEKELNMKTLTPTSPDKNRKVKEISDTIDGKHAKSVTELERMIQTQNSLMEKLSGECRSLKDRLEDANNRHKSERTQLHYRNSELMRKLRSLWCSHKKYCTSSVVTLKSYTPLSGYANSRSSYDLDRSLLSSTPSFYRAKYKSLGDLYDDVNLSMASSNKSFDLDNFVDIDKVGDLDKEELATVQRQVETLGQSMHYHSTPDYYSAQTTHPTPTNGNAADTKSDPRPNHTGSDTTGYSNIHGNPITSLRDHGLNNHNTEPGTNSAKPSPISRQGSKSFINPESTQNTTETHGIDMNNPTDISDGKIDNLEEKSDDQTNVDNVEYSDEQYNATYDPNYKESNYENQNYVQPYVEGQYSNYEQFEQNNSTYEESQYENYNQGPIYQNVEGYNQDENQYQNPIQYDTQTVPTQNDESADVEQNQHQELNANETVDNNRNNSPNALMHSQS